MPLDAFLAAGRRLATAGRPGEEQALGAASAQAGEPAKGLGPNVV